MTIFTFVTPFLYFVFIKSVLEWYEYGGEPFFIYLVEPTAWSLLSDTLESTIYIVFLFLMAVIIWIIIELTLIVKELSNEKYIVNVDIFNIIETESLQSLSSYIQSVMINYAVIISLFILIFTSILYIRYDLTKPLFEIIKIYLFNPEILMMIPALLIGINLFITTHKTIRKLIDKGVKSELEGIDRKHKEICRKITETGSNISSNDKENKYEELRITLDILENEELRIKQRKGKKYDINLLISIIATVLLPIITLIIQTWLSLQSH